jgi:hypothetical protein
LFSCVKGVLLQGFIIKTHRVRDEDLIVSIITPQSLEVLYRFYGARHSVINLGNKIDFEIESSIKTDVHRLRDVIHLGFSWMRDTRRLSLWQQFIALFYHHLQNTDEIDEFYYELLNEAALQWDIQSPKRLAIESYVKLLTHEGRLHTEMLCFYCDIKVENKISFLRAYLPAHEKCSHTLGINQEGVEELFRNFSTLFLSDKEVDRLWYVLLKGL